MFVRAILFLVSLFILTETTAQVATGIQAEYHNGQIFLTWHNVPGADSGFYYVYSHPYPITSSNIQQTTYLGRVLHNFGYDIRLTVASVDHEPRKLVINDNPRTPVRWDQNLFVMNCTVENQTTYFAVRCDYGNTSPNWMVIPGANAIEEGFGIKQHLDPVKAYLQESDAEFPGAGNGEKMDVYVHYGSNVAAGNYPEMTNEGCLAFHFGIIKSGPMGANNKVYLKFHGGNGNFITNAIGVVMDSTWKISFDDWIPNFHFSSNGYNTRWFGYHENFNVFDATVQDTPPDDGVVKAYTYKRVNWEIDWILNQWPASLDSNRMYLVGSSQGCAAVWVHSMVDPERYAAGSATDGKLNMDAPDDDNPECKYNEDGAARKETRILWGNEDSTNLFTDIPTRDDPSVNYKIYHFTNVGHMLGVLKNYSLPFLQALNGKEDDNTCWEEKINVYASVDENKSGGQFYWDLRGHGGGDNQWKPINIQTMQRYRSNYSYPAFSYCEGNGDPGDTNNPNPPYYDGDSVGTINGIMDYHDSLLIDTDTLWQASLYCFQAEMITGSYFPEVLPDYYKSDVTIRRAQYFKNFPDNTALCWTNTYDGGEQTGTVFYKYSGDIPKPITINNLKIYATGSLLQVRPCDTEMIRPLPSKTVPTTNAIQVYPSLFNEKINGRIKEAAAMEVKISLTNMMGETVQTFQWSCNPSEPYNFEIPTLSIPSGLYFLTIENGTLFQTFKLAKQ